MILFNNVVGRVPVGRDVKHIKADFLDGEIPSWIGVSNASVSNNSMSAAAGSIDINIPVTIKNSANVAGTDKTLFLAESISAKVNNFRVLNGASSSSIELVSSNGWKIGLYGIFASSSDKHNYFKVTDNNGDELINEIVGGETSVMISPTSVAYQSRPKNLEIIVQPEIGHFHISINGGVKYSYWNLSEEDIDWTGTWKFRITSESAMCMSSIEMELQQNI